MKRLMKIASLTALVLLVSGCNQNSLMTPTKPKIDETLEVVDSNSIKSISDITTIAFEWRKVDDPRVVGYNFYRANLQKDGSKLKLIDTVKNRYSTHFVDKGLEPNTKYVYKISSATDGELESKTTNDYVVSTLPRLEPVSFIQAISNLPRQIKIIWRPHSNERIKKYKIERNSPENPEWEEIAKVNGRLQAEYIDLDLEDNVIYNYRVIAQTFNKVNSEPSQIVKAQTKPLPNGILGVEATRNLPRKIAITWRPSSNSDILKYNIYRSTSANSSFKKIKSVNVQTLQFEDFINEDAKTYFYKISSVDKDGLESNLNVNSVMGSTLAKPNKPIMTLAQIQGEKAILNWQSGDNRTVSYNVYKTIKKNFFSKKTIKIEGIKALRFEDKDIVRGVEYSYCIQSVDENGLVSAKTNNAELILPKQKELN